MLGKKATIFGLALLLGLLVLSPVSLAEEEENDLTVNITTASGTTGEYGGGDYYFIKFGTDEAGIDSAFGVVWGTEEHPNTIKIITVQARYLGVANVSGEGGSYRHMMKVYTYHGIALGNLIEFNDSDQNGMLFYDPSPTADDPGNATFENVDTVYNKRVPMWGAWTASNVTTTTDPETGERTWTFTLSRENLTYRKIWWFQPLDEGAEGNTLDRVEFTFHLRARMVEVNNVTIPQYSVEVEKGTGQHWKVTDVEKTGELNVSGKKALYGVKWDHLIEGWDFNPENQNPMLLLETRNIFGNAIPPGAKAWMRERFMNRLGEGGCVEADTENGTVELNDTDPGPPPGHPRLLRANRIEYEGGWTRVARFTWVSNVTVDDEEMEMHAQIHRAAAYAFVGPHGRGFAGFAFRMAFTYPGGESIFHDPGVDGSMYLDLQESSTGTNIPIGANLRGLAFLGILVIAAIVVVAVVKGRKKPPVYHDQYVPVDNQQDQWDRYYRQQ